MTPLFAAAARAKAAQRHLRTAQELEARWDKLSPSDREELRGEMDRLRLAAKGVQTRLSYGVRGFVHEFKAAKDGKEAGPIDEGKPLDEGIKELYGAIKSVRTVLDRIPPAEGD